VDVRFVPALENTLTNNGNITPSMLRLWLLPLESAYTMQVRDAAGRPLQGRARARSMGKSISAPLDLKLGKNFQAGYRGIQLVSANPVPLGDYSFDPLSYFTVSRQGSYHLSFQLKVIWITSGWKGSLQSTNLPVVDLPAVEVVFEVDASGKIVSTKAVDGVDLEAAESVSEK
jgi:hypothetical protein